MQWWLILLVGLVFGILVIAAAGLAARTRVSRLRQSLTTLDEHKRGGERLNVRVECLQKDIEALQAKLSNRAS